MKLTNGFFEWNLQKKSTIRINESNQQFESFNGIIKWNVQTESSNRIFERNLQIESLNRIFELKIVVVSSTERMVSFVVDSSSG